MATDQRSSVADLLRHARQLGAHTDHIVGGDGHVRRRWLWIPHADGQPPYAVISYDWIPRHDAWQDDWTSGYAVHAHWHRGHDPRKRLLMPVRSYAELSALAEEMFDDITQPRPTRPTRPFVPVQLDLFADLIGAPS